MPTDHHAGQPGAGSRAGGGRQAGAIACALLALCAAVVAGVAWTRPPVAAATTAYHQVGRLSYGATTSPSSIYGRDGLSTGQPIYGSSVQTLRVAYSYRFLAPARTELKGTEQLLATISNGQGITRTIRLQPLLRRFNGPAFRVDASLDLSSLSRVADAFDRAAGAPGDVGSYPVTIGAAVTVHGRLGSEPVTASFDSPVNFTYSGDNLIPGTAGGSGSSSVVNFAPSTRGSVSDPAGTPALLPLGLSVADTRVGSLVVLLAALLLLALLGRPLWSAANSEDEPTRIAARYGSMLVPTDSVEAHLGVVTVELESFEGVLQVARRLSCPILHCREGDDVYAVVDSGTMYRYRSSGLAGVGLDGKAAGESGRESREDGPQIEAPEKEAGLTGHRNGNGRGKPV
ncbi:MAG: hypothetical protein ACRDX8_04520 [Acidimicrobiales bacterium]